MSLARMSNRNVCFSCFWYYLRMMQPILVVCCVFWRSYSQWVKVSSLLRILTVKQSLEMKACWSVTLSHRQEIEYFSQNASQYAQLEICIIFAIKAVCRTCRGQPLYWHGSCYLTFLMHYCSSFVWHLPELIGGYQSPSHGTSHLLPERIVSEFDPILSCSDVMIFRSCSMNDEDHSE